MGGNRVHSFSSLLKNLCTLKIPDEITPQINKRLVSFPLFVFYSFILKSKFYRVLSNRADGSVLFLIWQDFLEPFFINHTLQFVKC